KAFASPSFQGRGTFEFGYLAERLPRETSRINDFSLRSTASAVARSSARYRRTSSTPAGVSVDPPPRWPPVAVATAGRTRQWFVSSTRSHARRYDIPSFLADEVMEPGSAMASRSATLPG